MLKKSDRNILLTDLNLVQKYRNFMLIIKLLEGFSGWSLITAQMMGYGASTVYARAVSGGYQADNRG